jgi:hypothetical protein
MRGQTLEVWKLTGTVAVRDAQLSAVDELDGEIVHPHANLTWMSSMVRSSTITLTLTLTPTLSPTLTLTATLSLTSP